MRMSFDRVKRIWLSKKVTTNPEALSAIGGAKLIIFCPGSMYGSVIINLLPLGMKEKLEKTKAVKLLMTNIMSVANENRLFSQIEYSKTFKKYIGSDFDLVLMPDFSKLDQKILKNVFKSYSLEHSRPIRYKENGIKNVLIEDIAVIDKKYLRIRHSEVKMANFFARMDLCLKKDKKNKKMLSLTPEESMVVPEFKIFLKKFYWALFLIGLGVVVVFGNGLRGDFVSDDYATVPQNPLVADFRASVLTPGNMFNSMNISNYILANIFGVVSPVPYHVFSLLTYLVSIFLVFWFVYLITGRGKLTILTTLIFAFMPIHVEAVSWNAGKIYLIISNYILVVLISFIYLLKTRKLKYGLVFILAFVLAFLTDRPRPFAVFLIIPGLLALYPWKLISGFAKSMWKWLLPILVIFLLSLFLI